MAGSNYLHQNYTIFVLVSIFRLVHQTAIISFAMSIYLPACLGHLGPHWTDFH